MQAAVRTYTGKGAKELFDLLEERKSEVERQLRTVKGLVAYTLARSGDGGFSVTVLPRQDRRDESMRVAKDWIAKNAGGTGAAAPKITEGSAILHFKA